jgi:VWFA-related protein
MRNELKLAVALFIAGAMAHGLPCQESASPKPATDSPLSQTQKSETEPKQEVSMQDTVSTFKLRVNLVQVHVIVRGDKGKPVDGLRKEDFQLFDNGKLQTITTFGVEDAQSRKERTEAAAKTQVNQEGNNEPISGATPDRFIALTFDDVHMATIDIAPMRAAADRFIDAMGPGDRVGIFSTSKLLTQDFTSDKELLKQKLLSLAISRSHLISNPSDCPNVSYDMAVEVGKGGKTISTSGAPDLSVSAAFMILYEQTLACAPGLDPKAVGLLVDSAVRRVLDEGEAENRNVYRELESVLRLLSSKPGERILLLSSSGFPVAELTSESSALVDHANRSNIVINTIDARGLYTADLFGDISEPYTQPAQLAGQAAGVGLDIQTEKQFVLGDFAYGTGGRFFHNSNDLEGGLKQLGMVPDVSYVLGFSPQNQKMDGRFHTIKVTLTGKQKYAIQARRGYYAPKQIDDPQQAEKQEMQDAVFSRDEIYDLPLTLQTQYFKTGDTVARISVVSRLDIKSMRFRMVEGKHSDDVNFATAIFDNDGNYVIDGGKLVKLRLENDSFERLSHSGLVVKSSFELKPGKYLIRQVVRDSEGAQMAARNGIVVIPN